MRIDLAGPLTVRGPEDTDLTPRGARARALLALVASDPDHSRAKEWIRSILWSDRSHKQAVGSLRQIISEVRRALGTHGDLLHSDRNSVWFEPDTLAINLPKRTDPAARDFIEGLDVPDPQFAAWRQSMRAKFTPILATPRLHRGLVQTKPLVHHIRSQTHPGPLKIFEDYFVSKIDVAVKEVVSIDTTSSTSEINDNATLTVETGISQADGGGCVITVTLTDTMSRATVWRDALVVQPKGALPFEDVHVLHFANHVTDKIIDHIGASLGSDADTPHPDHLAHKALGLVFSLRSESLGQADRLLAQAYDMDPRGIYLAWRAQLRSIETIERLSNDAETRILEAQAFCRKALEIDPNNSTVLATVSSASLVVDDDMLTSYELARRSVELNPTNPLAWDSLASASLYSGRNADAHTQAIRAQTLGSKSDLRFWWDMGRCLTAGATGQFDEAAALAEISARMSPNFRPPLRYLTVYYALHGDVDRAIRTAKRLKVLEPDFNFDRLALDDTYPVDFLKRFGLHDKDVLSDLEV